MKLSVHWRGSFSRAHHRAPRRPLRSAGRRLRPADRRLRPRAMARRARAPRARSRPARAQGARRGLRDGQQLPGAPRRRLPRSPRAICRRRWRGAPPRRRRAGRRPRRRRTPLPRFGAFDLVTCLNDAINHLVEPAEVLRALAGMRANLDRRGLLVFDVNTFRAYRSAGDVVSADDDRLVAWRGRLATISAPGALAEVVVEIFERLDGDLWQRRCHRQPHRHYPLAQVRELVAAGRPAARGHARSAHRRDPRRRRRRGRPHQGDLPRRASVTVPRAKERRVT